MRVDEVSGSDNNNQNNVIDNIDKDFANMFLTLSELEEFSGKDVEELKDRLWDIKIDAKRIAKGQDSGEE